MNGGISITLEKRSCKNLIFWICNMKQLNFSHFNTNSKFFSKRKQKRLQKMSILFCLVYQRVFGHIRQFPIIQKISKEYRRFTNSAEDFRRVLKMFRTTAEDFRGEIRKFATLFSSLYSHVKDIFFTGVQIRFLHKKPSKNLSVFSPETINIKKLANLTANTKRLDLRRSHEWFSRQIKYACATRSRLQGLRFSIRNKVRCSFSVYIIMKFRTRTIIIPE